MSDAVTVVIVNYKTEHLVRAAVESVRKFYPQVAMIVIDNGSHDSSTEYIKALGKADPHTIACFNASNKGHGPALHEGMTQARTRYGLAFDSDCTMLKPGLLEAMLREFADDNVYAVGWLRWVNDNGVPHDWHVNKPDKKKFHPYIHPCCGLYDLVKYQTMRPFTDHGASAIDNMRDAEKRGYGLIEFPFEEYVRHLTCGTRRMFDGHWHPADDAKPKLWDAKQTFPI